MVPVNYVLHDGAVWIRSTPYSMLAREAAGGRIAFEVDGVDESPVRMERAGQGTRRTQVSPRSCPARPPGVDTWPEGPRPFVLSIDLREVTGKRLLPS